jgi:hypothetical protein
MPIAMAALCCSNPALFVVHINDRGEGLLPASDARAGKGKHGTRTGPCLYAWSEYRGSRGVPLRITAPFVRILGTEPRLGGLPQRSDRARNRRLSLRPAPSFATRMMAWRKPTPLRLRSRPEPGRAGADLLRIVRSGDNHVGLTRELQQSDIGISRVTESRGLNNHNAVG